ncbi:hypothetical protein B7494_g1341 [Chlorociboria aeruginascens]|nr:hypothetical protein B7494_g1341 [Chlorociboria aeruginascens]
MEKLSDSDSDSPSASLADKATIPCVQEITEDRTDEDVTLSVPDSDGGDLEGGLDDGDGPDFSVNGPGGGVKIKPRGYQLEMLEESLKGNLIVAMDTGSGKTHVAVLRIQAELERMPSNQFIWFLAPTISLCSQQYEYIKSQITAVQTKFLSGNDGVERWTHKSLWDVVLKDVKIVVSTYQILLDALSHDFVRMESLALIVFDEAHNCVGKHPGSKIMKGFYHTREQLGLPVPSILGLSASPVMRSDPLSLEKIEETLDARCRAPIQKRAELRLQIKLPVLSRIYYQSLPSEGLLTSYTRSIESLGQAFKSLDIMKDPYVLSLIHENTERSMRKLAKARATRKTWCQDQMRSIHATALKICRELGAWAADYYISEVVSKFVHMVEVEDSYLGIWDVSGSEKKYLAQALAKVTIKNTASQLPTSLPLVSDKVAKMIELLTSEDSTIRGIIFVQERAMVSALTHLLSIHPSTRDRFRIGTMVGTSVSSHRTRNVGQLIDLEGQKDTLSLFKSGQINLVVATNVLEEGIDVPACNIVICFQKPANLKSFVQRRGRARQRDSKLVLLLDPALDKVSDWEQLEMAMKSMYEDDMRALQGILVVEDKEEHDGREFRVKSTGALLDLDNAVAHLYHFCATLPAKSYVDLRPDFLFSSTDSALIRAKVVLPLSVHEAVRVHDSKTSWMSEKNAIKDAAFEAYVALYEARLINDNLLPLLRHDIVIDELTSSAVETRASIMSVQGQLNPWIEVSQKWKYADAGTNHSNSIVTTLSLDDLKIDMYLPIKLPPIQPFRLHWDEKTELIVTLHSGEIRGHKVEITEAIISTRALLKAGFGSRFPIQEKQSVLVFRTKEDIPLQPLKPMDMNDSHPGGIIKDKNDTNVSYIFKEWLPNKPPFETIKRPHQDYKQFPEDETYVSLTRLSRRSDFLHRVVKQSTSNLIKPYSYVLPTSRCIVDGTPFKFVQFALLIPSIIHRIEIHLIAEKLSKTLLKDVGISDLSLIITAISASSACEDTDYQRLEFLGDSILKMSTSVQLMGEYPLWHEGYLSAKKDRLVANSRLARAAVEVGLDKFIITKAFTGHKWRPIYVEDLLAGEMERKRDLSSKVLADVVEALIGAAMTDGGIPKALACLRIFLPEMDWQGLESRQISLYRLALDYEFPAVVKPLEDLIGYEFKKKALLIEAVTHASYNTGQSLERFEFLGDAILDYLVVMALHDQNVELSHIEMHHLRTALVNADFLAFICMEWSIEKETTDIVTITEARASPEFQEITRKIEQPLWRFMRHHSPGLGAAQIATSKRHKEIREDIKAAIEGGTHYPWALLARLQADKFFSDMVESLLGAIWIDTGSFEACQSVMERMGILPYLRRILKDNVHIPHPKEEIGILADTETVKYVIESEKNKDEGKTYTCKVFVGGKEVLQMGGGVSQEEIKTKAAEVAVRVLKAWKAGGGDVTMKGVEENFDGVMDVDG